MTKRDSAAAQPPADAAAQGETEVPKPTPATPDDDASTVHHVNITDLKIDPPGSNPRLHDDAQIEYIADSFRRNGAGRGILIGEDLDSVAGTGTILGAMKAGVRKVKIVDAERDELVAVRRLDMTDEEKRRYAFEDNLASDMSPGFDPAVYAQLQETKVLAGVPVPTEMHERLLRAAADEMLRQSREDDESAGGGEGTGQGAAVTLAGDVGPRPGGLSEDFLIPPFSVLNAQSGRWQERKRQWLQLGIQSELGRADNVTYGDSEQITRPGLNYYREQNAQGVVAVPEAHGSTPPAAYDGGKGTIIDGYRRGQRTMPNGKAPAATYGGDFELPDDETKAAAPNKGILGLRPKGMGKKKKGAGAAPEASGEEIVAAADAAEQTGDAPAEGHPPESLGAVRLNTGGGGLSDRLAGGGRNRLAPGGGGGGAWLELGAGGRPAQVPGEANPRAFQSQSSLDRITGQSNPAAGTSIFDPVLCEVSYLWFTAPGSRIIDPFAGGSVRGIVAAKLGREYVGIDLRPEQIAANEEQAQAITPDHPPAWVAGDSRDLGALTEGEFDFIFTCPPYADLEVYSDDPRDISTMRYPEFLEAYRAIIAAAAARLRDDRFAAVVVGEVRDTHDSEGFYYDFVGDTKRAFGDAGLRYYNELILVTAIGSLPVRAGRQFRAGRKIGKTHQNVLVFCKGSARRATAYCGDVRVLDLFEPEEGAAGGAAPTEDELRNAGVAVLRPSAPEEIGGDYGERLTAADIDPDLLANTE
jgi:hypothetical protein